MGLARAGILGLLCMLLAACGGGGGGSGSADTAGSSGSGNGETLYVSVIYPGTGVDLFNSTTVVPTLTGFKGHAPHCVALSGNPNNGMSLNDDCSVSGRPTQPGNVGFLIRVTASGASNAVDTSGSFPVKVPTVSYFGQSGYKNRVAVGETVALLPSISGWTAPGGVALTWNYTVRAGALPPGLTLDSATGMISGTTASQGAYASTIDAQLGTPYGTYRAISNYEVSVNVPIFGYLNEGGTGSSSGALNAFISQPFKASPISTGAPADSILGDFHLVAGTTLPPGIDLNAVTGEISGMPSGTPPGPVDSGRIISLQATIVSGGVSSISQGSIRFSVNYPMYVGYGFSNSGRVGVPLTVRPQVTQLSPVPLVTPSYRYAPRNPDCSLPPGMSLDPFDGTLTGTPSAAGAFSCFVTVSYTNNGVSWDGGSQIYVTIN